jgi:hypothetical protein
MRFLAWLLLLVRRVCCFPCSFAALLVVSGDMKVETCVSFKGGQAVMEYVSSSVAGNTHSLSVDKMRVRRDWYLVVGEGGRQGQDPHRLLSLEVIQADRSRKDNCFVEEGGRC